MRAFTLVEVLVVLGILSILSLIAVPYLKDYVLNGYRANALANARICLSGNSVAQIDNATYTPPSNCTLSADGSSCTCTVSGMAGSVTCTLAEGGAVSCE